MKTVTTCPTSELLELERFYERPNNFTDSIMLRGIQAELKTRHGSGHRNSEEGLADKLEGVESELAERETEVAALERQVSSLEDTIATKDGELALLRRAEGIAVKA
jgi:chromosome segregation ATPase